MNSVLAMARHPTTTHLTNQRVDTRDHEWRFGSEHVFQERCRAQGPTLRRTCILVAERKGSPRLVSDAIERSEAVDQANSGASAWFVCRPIRRCWQYRSACVSTANRSPAAEAASGHGQQRLDRRRMALTSWRCSDGLHGNSTEPCVSSTPDSASTLHVTPRCQSMPPLHSRKIQSNARSRSTNVRDNRVAAVDCPFRNRTATATSVHRLVRPAIWAYRKTS